MKILIADDHPVVLQGICLYLASKNYKVVSACNNGIEAWNSLLTIKPDVALLDHNMPGMSGMEIAEKVHAERLGTKIVLLTMHKEKALMDKAIALGVKGYLLKDFALDEIVQCLQNVGNGLDYYSKQLTKHVVIGVSDTNSTEIEKLTPAEQKVLHVIATNKSSQEIADMLFISLKTVEKHRSNIIKKLGLPPGHNSLALWASKNIKQ